MSVFVLDKRKHPLMPCSEKRARLLLSKHRAVVHRMVPFTIRLKERTSQESAVQPTVLCNCNSTDEAVAQWCREHVAQLRQVFGDRPFLTPSASLYRKLLPRLDAQVVEAVLGCWIQAMLHQAVDEPIALDGKTLRGARKGEQAGPHLLSFWTHESQQPLFQVRVSEKTNDIPVAKAVLPIAGRVVTSDALHTHADLMQMTHDQRGKSLFTVKQNQPTLYANLATYFADPHASCQQAET